MSDPTSGILVNLKFFTQLQVQLNFSNTSWEGRALILLNSTHLQPKFCASEANARPQR